MNRRLVIPDIHGCSKTLIRLLETELRITPHDTLYFLGDYINKGPDSAGVLDYLIGLQDSHKVFFLMGNHEKHTLDAMAQYDEATFHYYVAHLSRSKDLLADNRCLIPRFLVFLQNLTHYYLETPGYILVHGGINFNATKPLTDKVALLELRNTIPDMDFLAGRRIVHGHDPKPLSEIQQAIAKHAPLLPLDNGCVYNRKHKVMDTSEMGNLCCLDLDSLQLTIQPNIDGKTHKPTRPTT